MWRFVRQVRNGKRRRGVHRTRGPCNRAGGSTSTGAAFLIYDCDDFTKNFYREHFGVEHFDVIDVDVKEVERPQQPVPPHNGFGSPEDTLQSVLRITPRRVRKDSRPDPREGRNSPTLPGDAESAASWICFYPSDETVSILERPLPNSGVPGGKFLRRMRLRKPLNGFPPQSSAAEPRYYGVDDFRVGNVIEAVGRRFIIVRADQFATNYIKRHHMETFVNGG
ncbi:hypothetical protein MTO96_008455 [Rhipicephalus appendiculatus]